MWSPDDSLEGMMMCMFSLILILIDWYNAWNEPTERELTCGENRERFEFDGPVQPASQEDQDEEVLKVQPCYDREHQIAGQHIASLYVNMRIAEQEQQILEQPVGDLYHISQSELQSGENREEFEFDGPVQPVSQEDQDEEVLEVQPTEHQIAERRIALSYDVSMRIAEREQQILGQLTTENLYHISPSQLETLLREGVIMIAIKQHELPVCVVKVNSGGPELSQERCRRIADVIFQNFDIVPLWDTIRSIDPNTITFDCHLPKYFMVTRSKPTQCKDGRQSYNGEDHDKDGFGGFSGINELCFQQEDGPTKDDYIKKLFNLTQRPSKTPSELTPSVPLPLLFTTPRKYPQIFQQYSECSQIQSVQPNKHAFYTGKHHPVNVTDDEIHKPYCSSILPWLAAGLI